jgi:hypothetical protein
MLGARFRMGKKTGRNEWMEGMDILWTGARQKTGKLQSEWRRMNLFLSFIWIDTLAVFRIYFSLSLSCLSLFLIN